MTFLRRLFLCLPVLAALAACASGIDSYRAEKPLLQPDVFFNGKLSSWGVFEDYRGRAVKRFTMQATAQWQGRQGTMHEDFIYTDGTRKTRDWAFTKTDDGHFIGTAPDLTGAAQGEISGNALHWVYTIAIPVQGKMMNVEFDDWLYLIDDKHLFSRVTVKKFGVTVGHLTMFFEKND